MHILKCMYMYMVNVICTDQCFFFFSTEVRTAAATAKTD